MPRVEQQFRIDVSPERYIQACDQTGLYELDLLLSGELSKIEIRDGNRLSLKDVLKHCLDNGAGISKDVKNRIREFLDIKSLDNLINEQYTEQ